MGHPLFAIFLSKRILQFWKKFQEFWFQKFRLISKMLKILVKNSRSHQQAIIFRWCFRNSLLEIGEMSGLISAHAFLLSQSGHSLLKVYSAKATSSQSSLIVSLIKRSSTVQVSPLKNQRPKPIHTPNLHINRKIPNSVTYYIKHW